MGDLLIKTMIEEMAELKRIRDEQANEIFRLNEEIKKYKNLYNNVNALKEKYEKMMNNKNLIDDDI